MHYIFEGLSDRDKARLLVLFERLGDHGVISNAEKFKKVEGSDFFEFKCFQVRALCFTLPGGRIVLTHGFIKKRERFDRREIDKAHAIRQGCINERIA